MMDDWAFDAVQRHQLITAIYIYVYQNRKGGDTDGRKQNNNRRDGKEPQKALPPETMPRKVPENYVWTRPSALCAP